MKLRRAWLVPAALIPVVSMAALALPGAASAATAPKNIILNPGAEAGPGSTDGSTVPVPKWTVPKGGTFTAVQYGASGGFPTTTGPGPKDRGVNFFAGGEDPKTNTQKATQTDSLSAYAGVIAAGASYTLRGYFGGFSSQTDHASLTVTWESSAGATLGTATVGPVTEAARHGNTGLLARSVTGTVPAGSAKVLLTIECVRKSGAYDDGYADSLSLTIVASA